MDNILLYLLKKNDFVSGEEISELFSISRTAVWKHIKSAKDKGIEVESVVGKGYKIKKIPDEKIIPEVIYSRIPEAKFGIIYLEEIDSTNSYAKKNITNFQDKDYLIITDNQTKGRGRFERRWESCRGKDLTFSIVIHPLTEVKDFYFFTIIASLSVYQSIKSLLGEKIHEDKLRIKWPNDIYYGEKKLCGILSEMISEEAILKSLIIGIGVNINSQPSLDKAIYLYNIINKEIDRHNFLTLFLVNFYNIYENYQIKREEIFSEWKKNLKNIGEIINFKSGEKTITGTLCDVNIDGSVVIKTDSKVLSFYSGEF